MSVSVSEKAMDQLKTLGVGGPHFLRVSVAPGGCAGMSYSASIDSMLREGDEVIFEQSGLRLIADPGSVLFVDGLEIDYSDDLIQAGFKFRNPNAKKACGCGSSFAV